MPVQIKIQLTWYYALNIIIVTWRKLFESNKLVVLNKHCVEVGIEGNFKPVGICIWYMRIKKEKKEGKTVATVGFISASIRRVP